MGWKFAVIMCTYVMCTYGMMVYGNVIWNMRNAHCNTCIPIMIYMTHFILLITIWYDMRNRRENEMKYQLGKKWSED